jgi:hypothetical protein
VYDFAVIVFDHRVIGGCIFFFAVLSYRIERLSAGRFSYWESILFRVEGALNNLITAVSIIWSKSLLPKAQIPIAFGVYST